jgi:hypothetical protein
METPIKEYKSIRTQTPELPIVANVQAQDDWRVLTVLPIKFSSVTAPSGLELTEIVILFERGNS